MAKTKPEPQPQTDEVDSIRTIYLSTDNHEALHSIAQVQKTTGSNILRTIVDDYLAGKLVIEVEKPRKTSVYMDTERWQLVREKAKAEGLSVSKVIDYGLRKLRGR